MSIRIITLVFIILISGKNSFGQVIFDNYTVESWTVKDGLPTEQILNITIDTNNFIWLNTYEGLVQFDGVKFKNYSAGDYPEIKSNNFYSPTVDKNNNLWIPTQFGKLFKIKNGTITTLIPKVPLDRIMTDFQNGDYLTFTSKGEVVIFNLEKQQYDVYDRNKSSLLARRLNQYEHAPNRQVTLDDGRKIVLIGLTPYWLSRDSLRRMDKKNGIPEQPWSASSFLKTSKGEIFLVGDDIVKIWNKTAFITYPGCEKIVINTSGGRQQRLLLEDKNGNLWLGTSNGVALRRKGQDNFEFLPSGHPLSTSVVTDMATDEENNIWVGSENGLYKITEGKIKMISKYKDIPIIRTSGAAQVLSGAIYFNVPSLNSFYKYENGVVLPVKFKDSILQRPHEVFHLHGDKKGNLWLGSFPSYKISPDGKELKFGERVVIRYVYEDDSGQIWFGVSGRGIGYLDGDSLKLLTFRDFSFNGQNISSIRKIDGEQWLITTFNKGLLRIDTSGRVTEIRDTLGYPGIGAFFTYQDIRGTFYVASTNGLFYFNGKIFTKILDQWKYLNTSFFEIIDDQRGSLWLTSNKGIVQVVKSELMDFVKGKIPKLNAQRYDEGDGMLNRQATGARHGILTREGLLMIPTLQGLAVINPDKMFQNTIPPHVVVNGIYFNSKPVHSTSPVFDAGVHQYIFDYSATSYVAPSKVKFKYILEGYDKEWSSMTTERKVTYTNLPRGFYTFRVKASNNDGVWNEMGASVSFSVNPYYYETWWFRVLVLLALGGIAYGFYYWRSRQIIERNAELQMQVHLRTAELDHSNKELQDQKSSLEKTLTELNSTQAQLIQSEKMASLGELTAGIAHEIQNPLNFVNNFSELSVDLAKELKDEVKKPEIDKDLIIDLATDLSQNQEKINHHGKRASDIVKGMLEHSRKSTGEKEPTDINALCEEYLRLAYHGLKAKDNNFTASMETHFDPNLPKIDIIPQDIGRVILNLINNAFYAVNERSKKGERADSPLGAGGKDGKKMEPDYIPTVSVTTKLIANTQLLIAIKDNGSGIPDAIREKIFQPFFTTKPTGQGTGLGLSLSYDIIKAHGGELRMESKEGEGSEFLIHLPIVN